MSKKGPDQVQTTTQTFDPGVRRQFNQLFADARGFRNRLRRMSPEDRIAGLSADELAAGGGLRGLADQDRVGQAAGQATGFVGDFLGQQAPQIDPSTASPIARAATPGGLQDLQDRQVSLGNVQGRTAQGPNRGNIQNVDPQSAAAGIDRFQDPFTGQVVDQAISDLDRARQLANRDVEDQSIAAGAFGGDRQAIAEAENQRNFLDAVGRTSGQLRSQGFQQAAQNAQQDANRFLQGARANQGVDLTVEQLAQQNRMGNADRLTQAAIANQGNQLSAQLGNQNFGLGVAGLEADLARFNANSLNQGRQFNAQQLQQAGLANAGFDLQNRGQQLGAAQSLPGLATQGQQGTLQALQGLLGFGGMQRGIDQQRIDQPIADFTQFLGLQNQIAGTQPVNNTQQTRVPTRTNVLGGIAGLAGVASGLGGIGGIGSALGGLFGGGGGGGGAAPPSAFTNFGTGRTGGQIGNFSPILTQGR